MGYAEPSRRQALGELFRGSESLGIKLSAEQRNRFQTYIATLLLWRTRLSLTAATTDLEIVRRHVLDALHVVSFVRSGFRVADLGSGAGFPGIPLAIACPQSTMVLIESKRRRANFLREVVRQAQLANVEVVEQRVEDIGDDFRPCDVAVSRAVWPLSRYAHFTNRLLRSPGLAIAMKGPTALVESLPHFSNFCPPQVVRYHLHDGIERVLITYQKA